MAESPLSIPDESLGSPGISPGSGDESRVQGRSPTDVLRASREKAFQEAKVRVREAAEAQRERAASAVGGVAGALHRAAGDLNAENETMGRYTDMAAERLDEVANYLRSTDWNSVVEGAEDFARRQPAWFIGGAVAAGFLIARTVKNSGDARRADSAAEWSRRKAASSAAGYGASTEPGVVSATTQPISPAPSVPSTGSTFAGGEG